MSEQKSFNPGDHLIKVQGNRAYLPVSARLVWFREQHPNWRIETRIEQIDVDLGMAIFVASVIDDTDRVIATGTKMETRTGFPDYVEKAETGAIGRALTVAGFGTADIDADDAPIAQPQQHTAANKPPGPDLCTLCGATMTVGQAAFAKQRFGSVICGKCQKAVPK